MGAIVSKVSAPLAVTDRIDIAKLGHSGLSGSAAQAADPTNPAKLDVPGVLTDWAEITEYMKKIRSPRAPSNVDGWKIEEGRKIFEEASCQGCHGGDKWTISTRFYDPNATTTAANATRAWTAPKDFPIALLPATTPGNQLMRFPATNGALDQIQCVLRPVGTFGANDGRAGAAELRADMKAIAQGNETDGKGYNPPSLLGLQTGAPYLHAGGALTLESLFAPQFKAHHGAFAATTLDEKDPKRAQKVEYLVSYLLSIDEQKPTIAIPSAGAKGGDFCQ